jgi:phosphatidate cytidylyltransferase
MLIKRILTAIILIPLVIAATFYFPTPYFVLLTSLVVLAAAWEWSNLMGVKHLLARFFYFLLVAAVLYASLFLPITVIPHLLVATVAWWLSAGMMVALYPRGSAWWASSKVLRGCMGLLVLVPCWITLNLIRTQENGSFDVLVLFILIWGADSTAYFVGRKWGKTKLAPLVSPGKSVEGVVGALVSAMTVAIALLIGTHMPLHVWPWAILFCLAVVIFSIVGDLFESMLKRQVGIKDSGKLLPGHGGLLDRIDSLTAAAPIFAFGAWLLSTYVH